MSSGTKALKKFNFVPGEVCGYHCCARMEPAADGEYVLAADAYERISAMLGELEDFAMQNDLPIEDGHGYFGTGLPLGALQEWLFKQKDALSGGDA